MSFAYSAQPSVSLIFFSSFLRPLAANFLPQTSKSSPQPVLKLPVRPLWRGIGQETAPDALAKPPAGALVR
jgi:hypothetical protein